MNSRQHHTLVCHSRTVGTTSTVTYVTLCARDAGFSCEVLYACTGPGFGPSFRLPSSAVRLVDDRVDDHTMHAFRTVFLLSFPEEYLGAELRASDGEGGVRVALIEG